MSYMLRVGTDALYRFFLPATRPAASALILSLFNNESFITEHVPSHRNDLIETPNFLGVLQHGLARVGEKRTDVAEALGAVGSDSSVLEDEGCPASEVDNPQPLQMGLNRVEASL